MEKLDRILRKYTNPESGSVHAAIFIVVDAQGKVIYRGASGKLTFDPDDQRIVHTNSLCWIASMTKLVTSVAVMQLVEKGVVTLDEDIREIVPELRHIDVLVGFKDADSSEPQTEKIKGPLTLRQLLSHSSGHCYDGHPILQKWSKLKNRTAHTFSGSMEGYTHPLIFQPGTSWAYGAGLDWAGRVIECKCSRQLEEYFKHNIWSKIGATCTTFHPEKHRDKLPTQLEMGKRVDGRGTINGLKKTSIILGYPLKNDIGGIGLFSTAEDYTKLLSVLIQGGFPLLSKTSLDLLFTPQLGSASRSDMPGPLGRQMRRVLGLRDVDDINQADHCLAGTITLRDIPKRRRKGTVNWSGLPNLHWWIDRTTGIAASFFVQIMPPGDSHVVDLLVELEEALYEILDMDRQYPPTSSRL